MERFDRNSTIDVKKTDRALILDGMSELATRMEAGCLTPFDNSWAGGMSKAQTYDALCNGYLPGVAASDEFMAKLESKFDFAACMFRNVDAVSGGVPIVPSYLAGHPLSMRRRERVMRDMAPLTMLVDTASSGSVPASDLAKRGAAILALARLLAGRRPIKIYAGIAVGNWTVMRDGINAVFTRLDTAPLDLARAAFALGHPGFARNVGYGVAVHEFGGKESWIPWAYKDADKCRKRMLDFGREIFPGEEIVYLPSVFAEDQSIVAPEKWLETYIKQYGGELAQEAA